MKNVFLRTGLLLVTVLSLNGCATYIGRTGIDTPGKLTPLYPATSVDVIAMRTPLFLPALIDLPFSLVTDTLLLPVDIYQMKNKEK